jgi:hypothetical protein
VDTGSYSQEIKEADEQGKATLSNHWKLKYHDVFFYTASILNEQNDATSRKVAGSIPDEVIGFFS